MYPQAEFPYERLVDENARRGHDDPEFELVDTGVFDDGRYWEITADYAKAAPEDLLVRISVRNAGPGRATIDVLPTLWFRNTWSWGDARPKPSIRLEDGALVAEHDDLGARASSPPSGAPEALFCENETNTRAPLRRRPHDAVPEGRDRRPRRPRRGDRQPGADRDEGRVPLPARGRRPARRAIVELRLGRAARPRRATSPR